MKKRTIITLLLASVLVYVAATFPNAKNTEQGLPPNFQAIKKKSKFINHKKFDLTNTIPCKFDGYQAMTKTEFNRLNLPLKAREILLHSERFKEDSHYYYAFQENLNGNFGIVILSCIEGMGNELTCLVFGKNGTYLGIKTLAYNGADMDMVWNMKGTFGARGKYKFEYKKYLGTKDQVCEWYKASLKFEGNGKISGSDTTYRVKEDPNVPCYEKKFKKKN
ncbi:hypothetical protein BKI52_33475 [marine bacterium AO1-C]|nr:hypothetical protein BKI52_33475 [marine bacterium AO1-C]